MNKRSISYDTLRSLFAKSGNLCAFPSCTHELISESNIFVAQLCHIEAVSPKGPRFNPELSNEDLRRHENLILLCYRHHKEIDIDPNKYSTSVLHEIKADHESAFGKKAFKVDESVIYKIEREMLDYWEEIRRLQREEHDMPELIVEIEIGASPIKLFADIRQGLEHIMDFSNQLRRSDDLLEKEIRDLILKMNYDFENDENVKHFLDHLSTRNWEALYLAIPNWLTRMRILMMQLEVIYLEEYLKTNSADGVAKERFKEVKERLQIAAKSEELID